jgi:hypothetical protein
VIRPFASAVTCPDCTIVLSDRLVFVQLNTMPAG